jgi:uncharacterized iron-regulated membrane protein
MISESLSLFVRSPRKVRFRSWAFNIHLYAGITVGLILVAITLSGSAIVFRNAISFALHRIDPAATPPLRSAPSLQSIIDRTRSENPGFTVGEVDGLNRDDGLRLIRLRRAGHDGGDRDVFVDSRTGAVVPGHPRLTDALEKLEDFHKNLLMGRRGRGINGLVALLFAAVVLTSPIVWWPGIERWARGLKIDLALSWKRVNYDLHNSVGILCLLFLSVMACTAVLMATPDVLHLFDSPSSKHENHEHHRHGGNKEGVSHNSQVFEEGKKHAAAMSNPSFTSPSIDRAIRVLSEDESLAAWTLSSIRFPEGSGPLSAELHRGTSSIAVDVDPLSGQIVDVGDPTGYGISIDAHNFVQAVHYGRVGGLTTQFLWVLLGLSPTVLGISGYLMWWNRVLSKKLSTSSR